MGVMREEMLETEEPQLYNDFAMDLKKKLLGGLGGDAGKEVFFGLRKRQLGLISVAEAPGLSEVPAADAKEVHDDFPNSFPNHNISCDAGTR